MAPMFEDDEFDFGGDEGEDAKTAGSKRSFADVEDDDEEFFPPKKMYVSSMGGGIDHATTTIINLRASLEERDNKISSLQTQIEISNLELEKWRKAFRNESILPSGTIPDPDLVLQVLQKLQSSESQLKEQLFNAKRREAAILVKLSNKEQEIVELKTTVHDMKLMMKPPAVQARRLLLDPAIHAEFTRMKIHELGTKLAMQKSLNTELRRGYQELYEYVEELNEEAERAHEMVDILQRQLQRKEQQLLELQKERESVGARKDLDDKEEKRESEQESTKERAVTAEIELVKSTDTRR
eukprot:c24060_g1_i3 orf=234-1124(+)